MRRMLFNATQAEELRVAIVDGQKLIDLDIESATKEQKKSNIYKAVITRIESSLEAAFVDYGAERHGFLPFKEIARAYFQPGADSRASIKEALREGQELIVQVEKDERGNKGAAMTTFISLAGRYLVLMPNNPRGGGVSRRVEGEDRNELRELIDQLEIPQGMSLIARTAAIGRSVEELQWDLNYLLQLWKAINAAIAQEKAPSLIYQEDTLVIRAIRDYFQPDIGEILIDTDEVFEQARKFMSYVMPDMPNRVKRYRDDVPLFSRFQIEHQIQSAYSREVTLPSGGAIVIDHTEALVSIDVNSGRSTRGADIEETAFKTNLEAAEEVARQLRLRDLGGLVVIDFIDMEHARNQREVESRLREHLRLDRARIQTGKISRFGLLELSRQRLRPALEESSYIPCPRCSGTGHIRSAESTALHVLRILEEEAMKENTAAVHAQIPVDVAIFLFNEKRYDLQAIELRHKVNILLIPNTHLNPPQHSITRLRHDELSHEDSMLPSYKRVEVPEEALAEKRASQTDHPPRQEAVIKGVTITESAPLPKPPEKAGFLASLKSAVGAWFGASAKVETRPAAIAPTPQRAEKKNRAPGNNNGNGSGRRAPQQRRNEDRAANASRDNARESSRQEENAKREPREPRRRNDARTPQNNAKAPPAEMLLLPDHSGQGDTVEKSTEDNATRRRGRRNGRHRGENRDAAPPSSNPKSPVAQGDEIAASAPEIAPDETKRPAPGVVSTSEDDVFYATEFDPGFTETFSATKKIVPVADPADAFDAPRAAPSADTAGAKTAARTQPDFSQAIEASGLVMIETDNLKMTTPAPAPAEEAEPRPQRRRRRPAVRVPDEPLVMIETKPTAQPQLFPENE